MTLPHDYVPTDAQHQAALQRAFDSLTAEGHMPLATLTEAMRDALQGRKVRMHAVALLRGVCKPSSVHQRTQVMAPEAPHPAEQGTTAPKRATAAAAPKPSPARMTARAKPRTTTQTQPAQLDRKRAAAGDRDD